MTQQYIGTKIVTAWPQERDGEAGFAVKYADGYTSWSPAGVFNSAYLPLGHIDNLAPHQKRVRGEHAELAAKLSKLSAFLASPAFWGLEGAERLRLIRQNMAMAGYLEVLGERIAAFGGRD